MWEGIRGSFVRSGDIPRLDRVNGPSQILSAAYKDEEEGRRELGDGERTGVEIERTFVRFADIARAD